MNKQDNISFLAISFSQGFSCPNIPIATFYQGNKKINFLLDTGSDKNVIDSSILESLEHEKITLANKQVLTGVGGTVEVGVCKIKFQYGNDAYETDFLISDMKEAFGAIESTCGNIIHGILGSLFLKENNIVLDFTNMTACSKK